MADLGATTRQAIDTFCRDHYVPGGVVSVVVPDEAAPGQGALHVEPFGLADIGAGIPVDADTSFEIGSLTKVFTGALLAGAIAAGTGGLSLDRPLEDYSRVRVPSRDGVDITIGDLVTHRAGLPKLAPGFPNSPAGRSAYSAGELWSALQRTRLVTTPGAAWAYSNMGFGLLGTVLAEQCGRSYADLVADTVTGPLGMISTGLEHRPTHGNVLRALHLRHSRDPAEERLNVAHGYTTGSTASRPILAPTWNNTGALAGSGGLMSTGTDMAALVAASVGYGGDVAGLRSGQLPIPDRLGVQTKPMGMAWQIVTRPAYPHEFLFKNGGTSGAHSAMAIDRFATGAGGIGVSVLSNGPEHVDVLAIRLLFELRRLIAAR